MSYVDCIVIPVPKANKDAYLKMAKETAPIFTKHGAVRVVENWGDDIPKGKTTDFFSAVKAEESETVALAWIEWPNKFMRDEGMKKVMADPAMQPGPAGVFDGKRMIFAGFDTILDTTR